MTHSIKFDQFDDNVEIRSINSLFRGQKSATWYINLELAPNQQKSFLTFSQAPVLARKRVLNPTSISSKPSGYSSKFTAPPQSKWSLCRLEDCPSVKQKFTSADEKRQYCFRIPVQQSMTVYLPQFELCRALFFHDAYLARSSLNSERFHMEFAVKQPDNSTEPTKIEVLSTSSYPYKQLDSYASRRVLSWILLDKKALQSYQSIGKSQILEGIETKDYRIWNFRFVPPELDGAKFSVRGQYDKESNSLFVYEIDQIQDIPHSVPNLVEICHPKFKDYSNSRAVSVPDQGTFEEIGVKQVIDAELANSDNDHILMDAPVIGFGFRNPFETKKISAVLPSTRLVKNKGKEVKQVSTEEGSILGGTPQADWVIQDDVSDDSSSYAAKFNRFFEMVDLLCKDDKVQLIAKELRKLPKLPRCQKHLIGEGGDPRALAIVQLRYEQADFFLLEVDTSDQAKALSSRLLRLRDASKWESQLCVIEQNLVRNSLSWPVGYLKKNCLPNCNKSIPHPRSENENKGVIAQEALAPWAERLFFKITELVDVS